MIPCIFQAGWHPQPWAVCPCAVSSSSGRAETSPQALHSSVMAPSRAKLQGIYSFTLTSCGFKATGQCKLCFPSPARLFFLLHSQECQQLLEASSATNCSNFSLQGASALILAQDGRTHLHIQGQICVLNARHSTVFCLHPEQGLEAQNNTFH